MPPRHFGQVQFTSRFRTDLVGESTSERYYHPCNHPRHLNITMAYETVQCTIHILALNPLKEVKEVIRSVSDDEWSSWCLVKGRPHGWVHPPKHNTTAQLLADDWDLFLLTEDGIELPVGLAKNTIAHLSVDVSVSKSQYNDLKSRIGKIPQPIPETPVLPSQWPKDGGVPNSAISNVPRMNGPGELKLDAEMVGFLSTTLPESVNNRPVSLFNLFKYPNKDSTVHGAYMEGFKEKFGPAAGAGVKFMGPVSGGINFTGDRLKEGRWEGEWHDANLVQYDSIWHYAYMLSTEVYQELNQQKMAGLEDTCILCVSEVELT